MASTQARQQAAKLARQALKKAARPVNQVSLKIIAKRHLKDGSHEFTAFQVQIPDAPLFPKNELLDFICSRPWKHNPPAAQIANYILQTGTYDKAKDYAVKAGYVINFYETGADKDFPKNVSCRQMMAFPEEAFEEIMNKFIAEAKADGDMDVQVNVDAETRELPDLENVDINDAPHKTYAPCDVIEHYRHYKSGKVVKVRAHSRGK